MILKRLTDRKKYGIALVVISILLGVIVYTFTNHIIRLNQYLHEGCNLPEAVCPFTTEMPWESVLGYIISTGIGMLGLYMFFVEPLKIEQPKKKVHAPSSLEPDEKQLFEMISANDAIFQSELVEKSGLTKVRVTRILDKLEAKGLIERRRRGMTNIVMIKNG